mgnify:FL=1
MQKNHKVLAVLACLALAAGTMAGCAPSVPPADSIPARTEEGTANPLNDGRLRYLYDLNSSGGGTLLRGSELLYRASPSESITLLYAPGQAEPAGWQLGRNDANGQRVTEVYDEAGQLIWSGSGAWRAALAGETLALEPGSAAVDVGPSGVTGCRLIDTASGTEYALPAETSGCIPTGAGQAVLTLNTDPAAGGLEGSSVVVLDLASGAELYRIDRAYAYRAYGLDGPSRCAGIQRYDPATETWYTDLYDPDTRTMYSRFETFCGENLICYQPEPGRYDVCALGETEPLASYEGPCSYWREGLALARDAEGGAHLYRTDGTEQPLFDFLTYSVDGGYAAFLLQDGSLLLYGPDGSETAIETGLTSQDRVSVMGAQEGCVLLSVSDADYTVTRSLIYDASGLLYDSDGSGYDRLMYLTMGPEGPLYNATRQGPGGGWLSDVVDSRGNALLTGLADVSWGDDLPDGVIAARRGFERGYLDLEGNWLYSESVFTSLADEDGSYDW